MKRTKVKIYEAAGVMLLMGIFWGCGAGEYEQRMEDRIKELKTSSKFNIMSPAVDVPGTQVSIRIPQTFKNPPLKEGAMVDGKPVDSQRVKLNVIDMPDLKLTYEGTVEDANKGKQPYYLYVGVITGPNRANFSRTMQTALKDKFATTTEPTDYQAQTPEGGSLDWKQCRATGNQPFYYVLPSGAGQYIQLPGAVELLCYDDQKDTLVILAWRMPTGIEQSLGNDLKTWINLVAGCVKVK